MTTCVKCGRKIEFKKMYCSNCRPDYFTEHDGEKNKDENGMFNVDKFKANPANLNTTGDGVSKNIYRYKVSLSNQVVFFIIGLLISGYILMPFFRDNYYYDFPAALYFGSYIFVLVMGNIFRVNFKSLLLFTCSYIGFGMIIFLLITLDSWGY